MRSRAGVEPKTREGGVALAILVWFLAAMSLLVASVVMQGRVDVKLAQLHAGKARAEAWSDGAINLALAEMLMREQEGELQTRVPNYFQQVIGDTPVQVSLTPLAGLVDLNLAPEDLLSALFMGAINIDENVARELAASVIEWRSSSDRAEEMGAEIRLGRFEAIEDLLLVPGFDRGMYESLRDCVYVSQDSQPTLDWMAAPVSVLQSLGMSEEESQALQLERQGEDAFSMGIPEALEPAFLSEVSMPTFRVDAIVSMDDTQYLRRRWVSRKRSGADRLPWHFFRSEPVRAITPATAQSLAGPEAVDGG